MLLIRKKEEITFSQETHENKVFVKAGKIFLDLTFQIEISMPSCRNIQFHDLYLVHIHAINRLVGHIR